MCAAKFYVISHLSGSYIMQLYLSVHDTKQLFVEDATDHQTLKVHKTSTCSCMFVLSDDQKDITGLEVRLNL